MRLCERCGNTIWTHILPELGPTMGYMRCPDLRVTPTFGPDDIRTVCETLGITQPPQNTVSLSDEFGDE